MVVGIEYWKTSNSIHSQGLLRCICTKVKAKAMLHPLGSNGVQFTVYINLLILLHPVRSMYHKPVQYQVPAPSPNTSNLSNTPNFTALSRLLCSLCTHTKLTTEVLLPPISTPHSMAWLTESIHFLAVTQNYSNIHQIASKMSFSVL